MQFLIRKRREFDERSQFYAEGLGLRQNVLKSVTSYSVTNDQVHSGGCEIPVTVSGQALGDESEEALPLQAVTIFVADY